MKIVCQELFKVLHQEQDDDKGKITKKIEINMLKNRRVTLFIFLNILGFVMALSPVDFMIGGGLF